MSIRNVLVVGAGTMGNGIAQVAATSGLNVTCMDVIPAAIDRARAAIAKSTAKLAEKGSLTSDQKARADAISFVSDLASAASADIAIEAATENPELKLRIFKDLDAAVSSHAIL